MLPGARVSYFLAVEPVTTTPMADPAADLWDWLTVWYGYPLNLKPYNS